ncbi:MAG TPA: hypothetical protein VIL57_10590 [Bacteroidia bacterium]
MAYDIKITTNFEQAIADFNRLRKTLKLAIGNAVDKALAETISSLKTELKTIVNETIKVTADVPEPERQDLRNTNVAKSKADIVKYLFGQDIMKSDYIQKTAKSNTYNPHNNIFTVNNSRLKLYKPIGDSSSLQEVLDEARNRIKDGILIDERSGKMYKPNPADVKGIKLECSSDTGVTLNSEHKFEAYKNSDRITRRGLTPDQRAAIVTVKQEDVRHMINNSLNIDLLVDTVLNGDYDTAISILSRFNKNGDLAQPIKQVTNLKQNTNLTPNVQALKNVNELIKNLKIQKIVTPDEIRYVLFSTYKEETEQYTEFFEQLRTNIYLWIVTNENYWFDAIYKAVVQALSTYDPTAKM